MKTIDIIKQHLDKIGINQTQFGKMVNLSYGTINRILNGKQELKPNTLVRIAEALNLPLQQLIDNPSKEVIEPEVQGYVEYDGEINKIKSFATLQKLYKRIEYETKVLPKDVKEIKALHNKNKAAIKKSHPNKDYHFNLEWDCINEYDATKYDCFAFKTSEDEKDGIALDFGNQCGGYPFLLHGHTFYSSESAYLCGQFSLNNEDCDRIQHQLLYERNGYNAKKKVKNANQEFIRDDWKDLMADWMLYVIWHKCQNADFAQKLMSIPKDAIIIEDSTTVHEATNEIWGSINPELEEARKKVARYAELQYMRLVRQGKIKKNQKELDKAIRAARNKIHHIGIFSGGRNLMGKVLKRCQLALLDGTEPEINYDLLREKKIYLFGKLLTFEDD